MVLAAYSANIGSLENSDWPKGTLDLPKEVHSVDALRIWLDASGTSVEDFKLLPAYTMALSTGAYPWLADL